MTGLLDMAALIPTPDVRIEAYGERAFLCAGQLRRNGMLNAFVALTTTAAPFDAAVFAELDAGLRATKRYLTCRLAKTSSLPSRGRGTCIIATR
jgi:hypothetical protein